MRRYMVPLLCLLSLTLLLFGCGKKEVPPVPPELPVPMEAPPHEEPAVPAESVRAAEMRLVRVEGDVLLAGEDEAAIPTQVNMRLFSGSSITTQEESRAGVSLDDSKAATIGAESQTGIRQSGRELIMELKRGELFFSVAEPVPEGESFEISTASMTLAIRGTSGYVSTFDETRTTVILTTGYAVITSADQTEEIGAGRRVIIDTSGPEPVFHSSKITVDQLPGLLAEELARDPDLMEEVLEQTEYDREALEARAEGRPFSVTETDNGRTTVWEYDGTGRLLTERIAYQDGGTRYREFDELGRVIAEERTGFTVSSGDPYTYRTSYLYTPGSGEVTVLLDDVEELINVQPETSTLPGTYTGSYEFHYTMLAPENKIEAFTTLQFDERTFTIYYYKIRIMEYSMDASTGEWELVNRYEHENPTLTAVRFMGG